MNSCTTSGVNETTVRPIPTAVLSAPSARNPPPPGRPPATLIPAPGEICPVPMPGVSGTRSPFTLGSVCSRSSTLRSVNGMFSICLSVMVWPTTPLSAFTASTSALTVTEVAMAPGSSVMLAVAMVDVSTLTFSSTAVLKPFASTVMRYDTGSRRSTAYRPSAEDVTVVVWPVPMLVTCTLALATTDLSGSKIVPAMPPRLVWAHSGAAASVRNAIQTVILGKCAICRDRPVAYHLTWTGAEQVNSRRILSPPAGDSWPLWYPADTVV